MEYHIHYFSQSSSIDPTIDHHAWVGITQWIIILETHGKNVYELKSSS